VGQSVVPDYFDEMLERIRDIRASERRIYLRIKDIFAMAAVKPAKKKRMKKLAINMRNSLNSVAS